MLNKQCPQCGASLHCAAGQQASCWCTELPTIMPLDNAGQCLCQDCLARELGRRIQAKINTMQQSEILDYAAKYRDAKTSIEHIDYTLEQGLLVFTAWYHLKRGSCCGNGCRNCPY